METLQDQQYKDPSSVSSEDCVAIRVSISSLLEVTLDVDWFRHSEDCLVVGTLLSGLELAAHFGQCDAILLLPLAAGFDDGVTA